MYQCWLDVRPTQYITEDQKCYIQSNFCNSLELHEKTQGLLPRVCLLVGPNAKFTAVQTILT